MHISLCHRSARIDIFVVVGVDVVVLRLKDDDANVDKEQMF